MAIRLPALLAVSVLMGVCGAAAARAAAPPLDGSPPPPAAAVEHLGTVDFPVSCATSVRVPFDRGVALLHDFWYDEAKRQFLDIEKADPACAMAHWGVAMSLYHQIWNRPDDKALAAGRDQLANAAAAPTDRERGYLAAAERFFGAESEDHLRRAQAYSAAMAELYRRHPEDVDAGAFYALSLLAAEAPDDTSNDIERKALAVLEPLFDRFPDNPGVDHYVIHACDTPSLAPRGLAAARHYGQIAYSGAHAVHMPGHIFARLGMWPEDIRDQLASVKAAQQAASRHQGHGMDQFHSDDFLVYAYLQIGDDADAKKVIDESAALISKDAAMDGMDPGMVSMFPYYRTKLPLFYDLETRDWEAAAALQPVAGAGPEDRMLTYWGRVIAQGHLRQAAEARSSLAAHEALVGEVRHGRQAYLVDSTGAKVEHGELLAWVAFAEGRYTDAATLMRTSADLQDKVGQGEVDIPAREMLADILLEAHHPEQALAEYRRALELSPNRFNALYHAGRAAEAAGDATGARGFYAALLKSADLDAQPPRVELEHARQFLAAAKLAAR